MGKSTATDTALDTANRSFNHIKRALKAEASLAARLRNLASYYLATDHIGEKLLESALRSERRVQELQCMLDGVRIVKLSGAVDLKSR